MNELVVIGNQLQAIEHQIDGSWMSIASAPKDGSDVILWLPGNRRRVWVGFYDENSESWYLVGDLFARYRDEILQPTHWIPLPAGPI